MSWVRQDLRWLILGCLGSLGIGVVIGLSIPARAEPAETVMQRIARTGTLVAGTRTDAIPFGFVDEAGHWTGYSIDLLRRVQAELSKQLNRDIKLELVEVNTGNRLNKVLQGEVDLVCGATSFTRSRDLDVDFSIGYFVTGTQLLVNRHHEIGSEFVIGVIPGTTNELLVAQYLPLARLVNVANRSEGLMALERGRIDALAGDGILLQGLKQTTADPDQFQIVPQQPYDEEIYACILPPNQADFKATVDQSLLQFMQGVLNQNPPDVALLETWFGPSGVVPIDLQPLLAQFQRLINSHTAAATQSNHYSSTAAPLP